MILKFIFNLIAVSFFLALTSCSTDGEIESHIDSILKEVATSDQSANKLIQIGKQTLASAKAIHYQKGIGDAHHLIGKGYDLAGKYDLAVKHHLLALEVRESISDDLGSATSLYNLARVHILTGLYKESIDYNLKSLSYLERTEKKEELAMAYRALGLAYQEVKEWDKAQRFYKKALLVREQQQNKEKIGWLYNDLAVVNELRSEATTSSQKTTYQSILDLYNKSLSINEALKAQQPLAWSHLNVGRTYIQLGQPDLALEHLQRALVVLESLHDTSNLISAMSSQGEAFLLRNDIEQATQALLRAEELSEAAVGGNHNKQADLLDTYNAFVQLYTKSNNTSKALQYQAKIQQATFLHNQLLDRIRREQLESQIKIKEELNNFNLHLVQVTQHKYALVQFLVVALLVFIFFGIRAYVKTKKLLSNYKSFTTLLLKG
jgi:tetratricopeptide (TPR) repeat protein